jgi:hypothetical protein
MIINSYTYQFIGTLFHESIYNVTITRKTLVNHLPFMNIAKFVTAILGSLSIYNSYMHYIANSSITGP